METFVAQGMPETRLARLWLNPIIAIYFMSRGLGDANFFFPLLSSCIFTFNFPKDFTLIL